MELTESIDSLNRQLVDLYGIDTITGKAMFRIVWSEDQYEKRLTKYTDEGLELLYPEVRELPKYKQWVKEKYVLERLVLVPEVNVGELPTQKMSYEPLWVFHDRNGDYLPPRLDASKLVIDSVYAALGKSSLAKYKDEEATLEGKAKRILKYEEELFGNESNVGDALAHNQAVIVPRNFEKES